MPRPPTAGAKTALILHLYHKVMEPPLSADLNKHLRALITETQLGSGIDVWLSIHMGQSMSNGDQQAFLAGLPQEYQGRTLIFDSDQLFGHFVKDEQKVSTLKFRGGLPVGRFSQASAGRKTHWPDLSARIIILQVISWTRSTGSNTTTSGGLSQTCGRPVAGSHSSTT